MEQASFTLNFLGERIPAHYIKEAAPAWQVICHLMNQSDRLYGIDTETRTLPRYKLVRDGALDPMISKIRLLQVYDGESCYVFDLDCIDRDDLFVGFLQSKRFIAHNALFDLQFFMRMGVDDMNIGCTYQLAKLLFHATYPVDEGMSAGLDKMVKAVFGVDVLKENQASDWSVPDLNFEQIEYAALDPFYAYKLGERLAHGLTRYGLERTYQLCKAVMHPIARMQLSGMGLDVAKHRENIVVWRAETRKAKNELQALTKLDTVNASKLAEWLELNLPEEIASIWPRTDSGKMSTDANTFAAFEFLEIVKPFSRFQKQSTLCSTFGQNLIDQICPADSRVHTSYNICKARTGRLSSSYPNLQNIPRSPTKEQLLAGEPDMRDVFIPQPGWLFTVADYNQIELRVAAEVSRDETMLTAYRQGVDLHKLTASLVSKKPIGEVTKADRQLAKAINFGLLFGLGVKKFAAYAKKSYHVDISEEDAWEAVRTFRETYHGYRRWQLSAAAEGEKTQYSRTPFGKLRRLEEGNTYGTSMNTPVQGGAGECMNVALIKLDKDLRSHGLKARMCNVVHDEIITEHPPEETEVVGHLIESAMTYGFQTVTGSDIIKGIVEKKTGDTWAQAKG